MAFQILNLSHVAFRQVLRNMDAVETITFALCSKLCKNLAISMSPKHKNYTIDAGIEDIVKVAICKNMEKDLKQIGVTGSIKEAKRTGFQYSPSLSPSDIKTVLAFIETACQIYNCHLNVLNVDPESSDKTFLKDLADWFKTRKLSIRMFYFSGKTFSGDKTNLDLLLNNLKSIEFLGLTDISKDFQFKGNLDVKEIFIGSSEWFKMQDLMKLRNASRIELWGSGLSSEHLNVFLRSWRNGEFPNLRNVDIRIKGMRPQVILSGIQGLEMLDRRVRHTYTNMIQERIPLVGGVRIRGNQGQEAKCVLQGDQSSGSFVLFV